MAEDTPMPPTGGRRQPEDKAHTLVLGEITQGPWSTARTALIGVGCMVLAIVIVLVLNSEAVLRTTRELPMNIRMDAEITAQSWHDTMTAAGVASMRETLHSSVQQVREADWEDVVPHRDETAVAQEDDTPAARLERIEANARLLRCVQSADFRAAAEEQALVKAAISPPHAAQLTRLSRKSVEESAMLRSLAERLCGIDWDAAP